MSTAPIVTTGKSLAGRTARVSRTGRTEAGMSQRLSEHQSSTQRDALTCKEKRSWFSAHLKVIVTLYAVSHFGITLLTISIALCMQDTEKRKFRDGTVISGVVGLTCIICSFFAGYDLFLAKYSTDKHDVRHGFHRRYTGGAITEQSKLHEGNVKVLTIFKEDDHLDRVSYAPGSTDKVDAAELPQNDNRRLSSPFGPTDSSPCKNHPTSRPPHMPPGEVYKQIREIRRLAQLPAITIQPPEDTVLRWSAEFDSGTDTAAQVTSQNRPVTPERRVSSNVWTQRIAQAPSCLPQAGEVEEPYEGQLEDNETHGNDRFSSATSRKASPDICHFDGLHQLPISPLDPAPELNQVSHDLRPEIIIRISAVTSLIPDHQTTQESNPLMTLWRQYVAKSSVDLSRPSSRTSYNWASRPRQRSAVAQWRVMSCIDTGSSKNGDASTDKRSDKYKAWSQAFSTLAFQAGEGGLAFSGV